MLSQCLLNERMGLGTPISISVPMDHHLEIHQHTGIVHPAAFPVHAAVWQCLRFLRRDGADQADLRTDRADPLQLLLRHL